MLWILQLLFWEETDQCGVSAWGLDYQKLPFDHVRLFIIVQEPHHFCQPLSGSKLFCFIVMVSSSLQVKPQFRLNLLFGHSSLKPMVNANLFSKWHHFYWRVADFLACCRFIAISLIKTLASNSWLGGNPTYKWFKLFLLSTITTEKDKISGDFVCHL